MLGSPRLGAEEEDQEMSILSPRNFLKMISTGIDGLRTPNMNTPSPNNYQQFVGTFEPYLKTFQE